MGLRDALRRDEERQEIEQFAHDRAWRQATDVLRGEVAELIDVLRERGAAPRPYHVVELHQVKEEFARGPLRKPTTHTRTAEHAVYVGDGWTLVPGVETTEERSDGSSLVITESTIVMSVDGGFARSVRWPGRGDVLRLASGFVPVTDPACPHGFVLDRETDPGRFVVEVAGRRLTMEEFFVLVVKHVTGRERWKFW